MRLKKNHYSSTNRRYDTLRWFGITASTAFVFAPTLQANPSVPGVPVPAATAVITSTQELKIVAKREKKTGSIETKSKSNEPSRVRLSTAAVPYPASSMAEPRTAEETLTRGPIVNPPVVQRRIVLPALSAKAVTKPLRKAVAARPLSRRAATRLASRSRTSPVMEKSVVREAPAVQSNDRQRVLLAELDRDLRRAQNRLNGAREDLSSGQRQLSKFTDALQQAMMEAGSDATGLHPFVRTAQRYAGTPYVWGGASARGFDCSGFIIRVMRDLGYKALPHSAAEQFRYGLPVAEALLKPGDLVFFANTYKPGISHVGIYLGRRRFIHAAGTGKGTIVSLLSESPYRQKYAGARRLVRVR